MKNKIFMSRVFLFIAFLALTGIGCAQIVIDENMAKAVFETIQNSDEKTFLSYSISEDRKAEMISVITGSTAKDIGIKKELEGEKVEDLRVEMKHNFNSFLESLKKKEISPKDLVFSKVSGIDHQFEIPNLKCYDIQFDVLYNDITYKFEINLFETEGDLFLFGFRKYN